MFFATLTVNPQAADGVLKPDVDPDELLGEIDEFVATAIAQCTGEALAIGEHTRMMPLQVDRDWPVPMFLQVAMAWTPARSRQQHAIEHCIRGRLVSRFSSDPAFNIQVCINIAFNPRVQPGAQIELSQFLASHPDSACDLVESFERAGFETLADVLERSEEELRSLEGVTDVGFAYLKDLLLREGLSLRN